MKVAAKWSILFLLMFGGGEALSASTPPKVDEKIPRFGRVKEVVGSTTLRLEEGREVIVIGIVVPPRKEEEAIAFVRRAVSGQKVSLDYDQKKTDLYGRLLAYVYVHYDPVGGWHKLLRKSGKRREYFLNRELVRAGLAKVAFAPPNLKEGKRLTRAELEAKEKEIGLWQRSRLRGTVISIEYLGLSPDGKPIVHPALRTKSGRILTLFQQHVGHTNDPTASFFAGWQRWVGLKVLAVGIESEQRIPDGPPPPYLLLEKIKP